MSLRTPERKSDSGAYLILLAITLLFAVAHCETGPRSPELAAQAVKTD